MLAAVSPSLEQCCHWAWREGAPDIKRYTKIYGRGRTTPKEDVFAKRLSQIGMSL